MNRLFQVIALQVLIVLINPAHAQTPIAVLDFELNDITALPNIPAEQVRTASMRPLLETALNQFGSYRLVAVDAKKQAAANANFGYLFRFDETAAKLGLDAGADWIVVAQHSKPSFLFSYLIAHLINVKTGRQIARFDIELKGNHAKVTQHGINALARKIDQTISKQSAKPKATATGSAGTAVSASAGHG
ncbi:MAG: DUF2380 domain-containing protein [Methylobacter sp.]|nr:MAG: DUF2380 domain-containing protein [Methylobacter sp.]